jgi:hypothetical protein
MKAVFVPHRHDGGKLFLFNLLFCLFDILSDRDWKADSGDEFDADQSTFSDDNVT